MVQLLPLRCHPLSSKFGSATTSIWAATSSSVVDHGGANFNTPIVGAAPGLAFGGGFIGGLPSGKPVGLSRRGGIGAAQTAGLHIGIPLLKYGELGLTLIDYSTTGGGGGFGSPFGNVTVYGANVKLNAIGRFLISGEVSKSSTQQSLSRGDGLSNEDNNAYQLNVGYNTGPIQASAG